MDIKQFEYKIKHEVDRLECHLTLLETALEYYENICPDIVHNDKAQEAKAILSRLFNNEIDYLKREPKDYFDLYEQNTF